MKYKYFGCLWNTYAEKHCISMGKDMLCIMEAADNHSGSASYEENSA